MKRNYPMNPFNSSFIIDNTFYFATVIMQKCKIYNRPLYVSSLYIQNNNTYRIILQKHDFTIQIGLLYTDRTIL